MSGRAALARPHAEGAVVRIRVSPGAARERWLGRHGDALKLAVRAAPERGRANRAACRLLSAALGLPPSAVRILHGERSRNKTLLLRGADAAAVARKLERILVP
ncbi:MAG: DUF167 domain-containing protein [Planctomycetota bacterium]